MQFEAQPNVKEIEQKKSFEYEAQTTVIYQIILSVSVLALKSRLLLSVFVYERVLVEKHTRVIKNFFNRKLFYATSTCEQIGINFMWHFARRIWCKQ